MANIYCGNNYKDPELKSKKKRIGTRYECLKKGVGVGLYLPKDKKYAGKYIPIDERKVYCGEAKRMPKGYKLSGSSTMCFFKGVGIGRALKAQGKGPKKTTRKRSPSKSRRK